MCHPKNCSPVNHVRDDLRAGARGFSCGDTHTRRARDSNANFERRSRPRGYATSAPRGSCFVTDASCKSYIVPLLLLLLLFSSFLSDLLRLRSSLFLAGVGERSFFRTLELYESATRVEFPIVGREDGRTIWGFFSSFSFFPDW